MTGFMRRDGNFFSQRAEANRRQALKSLEKAAQRLPGMVDCLV